MLRSDTLFGKRENSTPPHTSAPGAPNSPHSPLSSNIALGPNATPGHNKPASSATNPPSGSTNEVGSRLIVGPNIKLKGVEITDCDTLVVEGQVEATIDSRVIQITGCGAFKGSAEIDIAEIHGEFNGDLIARQKLVIYATGKVSGKVRYGKLVVEEGGQLVGDVQVATDHATKGLAVAAAAGQ